MSKAAAGIKKKTSRSVAPERKSRPVSHEREENKLISIRIPEGVIGKLRSVAGKKGNAGYQQLIKSYITDGLTQEEAGPFSGEVLASALEAIDTPAEVARGGAHELVTSKVIREDIRALAASLKDHYASFSGKTFLITGAFGFLGRYLVLLLKYLNQEGLLDRPVKGLLLDNFVTGYEQKIISDEHLVFKRHDVIEPFSADQSIDYIIHAAGIASPVYYTKYPIETMDVGTIGTRNMLEMARQKEVSGFAFMSSSEVYGDPDNAHVPTPEEYNGNVSVSGPRSCYDESKRFGETMCQAFWRVYGVPVKIIRPFNVYGPGIRPDDYRVLPNFIEHALRKEPLPIHGAGHNTRSFCYINDQVEGIFRVLFSEASGEAFNIGNPAPEISVRELAKRVAESMPFKVAIVNIDPPHAVYASSDPKRRCPDISKLKRVTGFEPRYGLKQGLARTIEWFRTRAL
ncbi:MAG: NAD-dependent epimerase/dehydratase family protein [Candidatus Omnitrophota bacterium]|jgi:UDP-glucuronate decarboxylase